ncbi:hypothetical protein RclHR1_00910032 [Rhizophagus clarus]|nr:hypothetical protein RclHR1_00910032 [Rhizophagus clarus]
MPATEAYEVLFRNWGGDSQDNCYVWEEDINRNKITVTTPDNPYYGMAFSCATFNGMSGDVTNGVLTQRTLDNNTTYWVIFGVVNNDLSASNYKGGYNTNTCFHVKGTSRWYKSPLAEIDEVTYEECQQIRDSK